MVLFALVLVVGIDLLAGLLLIPVDLHDFRSSHPYFHHSLLPMRKQATAWGPINYEMSTNSLGFRDFKPREMPLQSDKYRLLLMGDSHTEGVGVAYIESFAGTLQQSLKEEGIEVLNASAVSYSPKLYYLKTRYLLEELHLDFDALYVFLDISDVQNEYAYESFLPYRFNTFLQLQYGLERWFRENSFIYYSIRKIWLAQKREAFYRQVTQSQIEHNNTVDLYYTFFKDLQNPELLNNPDFHTSVSAWYSDRSLYRQWGRKGSEMMTFYMAKLVDLCYEYDIPITISVHPWRSQVREGVVEDLHVKHWQRFAAQNEVKFINLYSLFVGQGDADSVITANYIPQDNHWNAEGHRKVAEHLLKTIKKEASHAVAGMNH
jgi:lysophospholipase L1-like esterase